MSELLSEPSYRLPVDLQVCVWTSGVDAVRALAEVVAQLPVSGVDEDGSLQHVVSEDYSGKDVTILDR